MHYARMLFLERVRTPGDCAAVRRLFAACWGATLAEPARTPVAVSPALLRVGRAALPRAGPWAMPGALLMSVYTVSAEYGAYIRPNLRTVWRAGASASVRWACAAVDALRWLRAESWRRQLLLFKA